MKKLEDKICAIAGSARGIGAATARLFAEQGAMLALLDNRVELGEALAKEIRDEGAQARFYACDCTELEQVQAAFESLLSDLGGLDCLFCNVGTAIVGTVEEISEENWDRQFAINVKSMYLCSRYAVPALRQRGGGSIILMGSESGIVGFPMHPAYCASKGAVLNLAKSMALAHADDKIRVNCLCPGTIPTPLFHEFLDAQENKAEVVEMLEREHPLGLGSEEAIAKAALFLACDDSSYMTGAPLIVDGGYTAK